MARIIDLTTYTDTRGNLTVIEKVVPFEIKRIFYIYGVDSSERGKHRHKKNIQAAVCIKGSCEILCTDGTLEEVFELNSPAKCLLLNPQDWHLMRKFSEDAILMVLASEYFDQQDYIFEAYK